MAGPYYLARGDFQAEQGEYRSAIADYNMYDSIVRPVNPAVFLHPLQGGDPIAYVAAGAHRYSPCLLPFALTSLRILPSGQVLICV